MEILWMWMDDWKRPKNTTKIDPPQRIDQIKFENEVGICVANNHDYLKLESIIKNSILKKILVLRAT
jgi:hypothetical protein